MCLTVAFAGCVDNSTPTPQPAPIPQQDSNITENVTPAEPIKYAKLQGSFNVTRSDFSANKSRLISKDGAGNTIEWITTNESNTGATIKLTYYGREIQTHVLKQNGTNPQTIGYFADQYGYEITTGQGTRYKDIIIKGEWGK